MTDSTSFQSHKLFKILGVLMTEIVPSQLIRVFLLTENRLLREALVRVFRKRSDFLVVGQSGETALTLCDILDSKCDVLVIASFNEYWLPSSFTIDNVGQLGFKVVMIGMDSNEEQFLATIRAGVTGYLLKDASASDVVAAVRAVSRGEAVCPPQLCQTLFRPYFAPTATGFARSQRFNKQGNCNPLEFVGIHRAQPHSPNSEAGGRREQERSR
jgi:ActR/RegA family two-component response regulator